MGIFIRNASLSKNKVNVSESVKISVRLKEAAEEPKMYRLPFRLGNKKGNLKK